MDNQILGLNTNTFYSLVLLLLLIVLGIVSFHYYAYVSGKNGLHAGTGFGFSILGGRHQQN